MFYIFTDETRRKYAKEAIKSVNETRRALIDFNKPGFLEGAGEIVNDACETTMVVLKHDLGQAEPTLFSRGSNMEKSFIAWGQTCIDGAALALVPNSFGTYWRIALEKIYARDTPGSLASFIGVSKNFTNLDLGQKRQALEIALKLEEPHNLSQRLEIGVSLV